jgi:predicted nucleic acid-binding protein
LIDEVAGRIEAARRGIQTTGTLGVLRAAALREFVDLPTVLAHLLETNFRVSMELVRALLAEDAERRRPKE